MDSRGYHSLKTFRITNLHDSPKKGIPLNITWPDRSSNSKGFSLNNFDTEKKNNTQVMILKPIKDSHFSVIQMPSENTLICSFLFALSPPYRRGYIDGKKISRVQMVETASSEINAMYPSRKNVLKERIVSTCSFFDCNLAINKEIYVPYLGPSEKTILVSKDYELMTKQVKGIQVLVFNKTF